jgi:alpha-D-ribose 1-methylphosphonate 5-triphosphate synthase subunit PhnH
MLQSLSHSSIVLHQSVFRVLLKSLTHPGEIRHLPAAGISDGVGIIKVVSQTLLDHEVTFTLSGRPHPLFSAEDILNWTHSRHVPAKEADFIIITGPDGDKDILQLKRGSPEMPDTGATALFLLTRPIGNKENYIPLTMTGPGILPSEQHLFPAMSISIDDINAVKEANMEFPMGIDCFFLDPNGAVVGLPRSVTLRRKI